MSISQNFPNETPALSFDFARSQKLDPRITYARTSTGTVFDETGQLKTISANSPRFPYAFFRSRNLLKNTDYLSRWNEIEVGGSVTIQDHAAVAPDGTTTATLVTSVAGGSGAESIYIDFPINPTGTYTFSVFVKGGTQTSLVLAGAFLWNTVNGFSGRINPVTGTKVDDLGAVIPYPNGWNRFYFTATGTDIANNWLRFQIYFQTSGTVYLWGPQLEEGSVLTDYVKNSVNRDWEPVAKGLLLEPQTTNYSRYSEYFLDTWASGTGGSGTKYLNNSSVTTAYRTAPDGTLTASRFQGSVAGARITVSVNASPGTNKNQHVTYSVFAKSDGNAGTTKLRMDLVCQVDTTNYSYRATTNFNLAGSGYFKPIVISPHDSDGSVSAHAYATIEPLYNGWYRCSISFRTYNGPGTLNATLGELRFPDSSGDILIWGDQFEALTYPTSYLKTDGNFVTRSADLASIIGTDFTKNYNPSEGTFFAEFIANGVIQNGIYAGIFGVSSQTDPAPFNFLLLNPHNSVGLYVATRSQTITAGAYQISPYLPNRICKVAGSYSKDSYECSIDGIAKTQYNTANALVSDFDAFIFARNYYTNPGSNGNLTLSKVMYIPKKLNGLQLKSLTQ
jgi:hypothetical protein